MLKKLSLAALIAMGSMSVASATPLTEAIKGVDLSGMIRVRFYNYAPKDENTVNRWRTSSDFKFTIPVSEELKVVYKLGVEGNVYADDNDALDGTNINPNPAENLVFLKYSANGVNVIAGKIPVATSVTGSGHGEAHGAGAIATFKASDNVTLAGAWINALGSVDQIPDNTLGNDIYAVAALFNVDMVKGNVWYYHATNAIKNLYTVSVDVTPVENVDVHADYAAGKGDEDGAKTKNYFNVSAKYTQDAFCVKVGYAKTDKDDGIVVLDNDSPIAAVLPVEQRYAIANDIDTSAFYAKAGYNVDAKTNVYVAYAGVNDKSEDNADSTEVVVGGSYKYSKKMKFSALYSIFNDKSADNEDQNELKVEAKYSF
ncbi:major outer membrane protein [Nautilia profundicola AmH]|uniref:Major outer membrane protein n=1 Tax=Nautilia profundicola (strain ATCC BAA-1463 / DSM 18972 / AmH) TaxID=598659 RepID=B9L8C6_NAUPA|nr:porin [Nautilia profundicola]ACM92575.1 major outer membrane protein [Nautilia profundicola AmH]